VITNRPVWQKTEALDRLEGDEGLLRELCQIFLEESPKLLENLKRAIAEGDATAIMKAAYSLKGELGYLGAETRVASPGNWKPQDMPETCPALRKCSA